MLARFAALAKRAEQEQQDEEAEREKRRKEEEEEEEEKRRKEKRGEESSVWYSQAKHGDSPSKARDLSFHPTVVKRVDKADLVWAPSDRFKGGGVLAMARICEFGEAALDDDVDWPIPEDHTLVEFISFPTNLPRFGVIPPTKKASSLERCKCFDDPLHKNKKQSTIMDSLQTKTKESKGKVQWDPDRLHVFEEALRKKFSRAQARAIATKCRAVADEFLEKALERDNLEASYERKATKRERDDDVTCILRPKEIEESDDLSKYALKPSEKGTKSHGRRKTKSQTLRAGDYIEYQCKIFKVPRKSQIIKINPSADNPLQLANDDIIYATDLIVKSQEGDVDIKQEVESLQLSDFKLFAGEVLGAESTQRMISRQTKADLKAIAEETGVTLNTSKRSKKKARIQE